MPRFHAGLLVSSLLLAACVSPKTCLAANNFGSIGGTLDAQAGADVQQSTVASLGASGITATDGGDSAQVSLTTSILNPNVFTFDASAESSSATGSPGVLAKLTFQQAFVTDEAMRVTIAATIVKPLGDGNVPVASLVVNDGNGNISIFLNEDTGGSIVSVSRVLPKNTNGPHLISGDIFTTAGLSGTHGGSVVGMVTVTLPADLNNDLQVNGADLAIWGAGFGTAGTGGTTFADGDVNDDSFVNGADFLQWQREVGEPVQALVSLIAVPEPTAVSLLSVALACFAGVRPRRPRAVSS